MRDDIGLDLLTGLAFLLEEWAEWQGSYRCNLGYPGKSAVVVSGGSSQHFDDMCDESDNYRNKIVDAAVDELVPAQRAAIMRRYGIAMVFRFPRLNYGELLDQAHERLMMVLPRKGVDIPIRKG